ncbi:endoplasmic reticulum metallopeptidase 1 [Panicum miliaceum]|uniref:Vacuolar membrane protease n=1 Tax=Panicum miliaceum TaxID=4540 RepID=A0A3L6PWI8_PANMI|nr:endoplasmic reticulum metallopeptidase 1 [Panicum miliaceum]
MPRGQGSSVSTREKPKGDRAVDPNEDNRKHRRGAYLLLGLLIVFLHGSWSVYRIQFGNLPLPLDAKQAGKRGFSEASALEHVKYLTSLGPHPVGSDSLDIATQYVYAVAEKIKTTAHWEVDVQLELFHTDIGANRLSKGLFKGKTLLYSDLKHVLLRVVPKYMPEAEENLILVSSHIDTVSTTEGAGDCSSCVGVMLELARGVAQWAHGFKSGVLFLFNTGEEEGLDGAHSFITQHHWRNSVRFAIDLEAMGISGKSTLFQGTDHWALESFAAVAKYPSAQIASQDVFRSGAIKSATDFQIYQEVAGLPGLDFAYTDTTSVYHTKNDKMKLLKPGSLQHIGDNMLAFLLHSAASPNFLKNAQQQKQENTEQNKAVFFDILVGSSYIALIWLVSPAFAYGFLEATLSPVRLPKQLKVVTLVLGMAAPVVSSAGLAVRMADVIVGSVVRVDRNPGGLPDWLGNVIVAVAIAIVICFMLVYLLSYVHISGDKRTLGLLLCIFFGLSLALVSSGIVPAFTEDVARSVNVVHVVDATGIDDGNREPLSYISLFSNTPGRLTKELVDLGDEEFFCGRNMTTDFVTFTMKYGCWSYKDSSTGWSKSEVPTLRVESDSVTDGARQTVISVDTKSSTRWSLGINKQEIDDFTVQVDSEKLVLLGDKTEVDGSHTIQFAGGKNSPTKFQLTLYWSNSASETSRREAQEGTDVPLLVKLRTDVNRVTPQVTNVLEKLPRWSTPFGKSTSPYTLAFLTGLRVNI